MIVSRFSYNFLFEKILFKIHGSGCFKNYKSGTDYGTECFLRVSIMGQIHQDSELSYRINTKCH